MTARGRADALGSAMAAWARAARLAELWWTRAGGLSPKALARQRLQSLVRLARERSPFYAERYAGLPGDDVPLGALPPVRRPELMARFDDWVTDRRVKRRGVEAFLEDRGRIGEPFLGRYSVWKSSGTCGEPGIFLQDERAMAVYEALVAAQLQEPLLLATSPRALAAEGRAAIVVATDDHFASIASWQRIARSTSHVAARSFSVLTPLPRLVRALADWNPAYLAGYPSVLALLASEQAAGRLALAPALVWSGGEHLAADTQKAIEAAFGCPAMNEYGSSECLSIAHGCHAGWMHLDAEWVMLEPVDRAGRPCPPGELSHSVLVTNLANAVQPIIRYELGDRVVMSGAPCPCGNPLPALRVEGRTDEILELRTSHGRTVRLPPLAVATVVEDVTGPCRYQVAQVSPERLAVRMAGARDPGSLDAVRSALRQYLRHQSLPNVEVVIDRHPPRVDRPSGKLRTVVIEKH